MCVCVYYICLSYHVLLGGDLVPCLVMIIPGMMMNISNRLMNLSSVIIMLILFVVSFLLGKYHIYGFLVLFQYNDGDIMHYDRGDLYHF